MSYENGDPKECSDKVAYTYWSQEDKRRFIDNETIGDSQVSTVFLVMNHGWEPGEVIVWETMVFGGPLDKEQDRCSGNKSKAIAMHERMVARVRESKMKQAYLQLNKGEIIREGDGWFLHGDWKKLDASIGCEVGGNGTHFRPIQLIETREQLYRKTLGVQFSFPR